MKSILVLISILVLMGVYFDSSEGTQCQSVNIRLEDETFSKHTIQVGEAFTVNGTIVNLYPTPISELKLWSVIAYSTSMPFLHDFLYTFDKFKSYCYTTDDGNIDWYFEVTPDPLEEFTLEPNDAMEYSISLTPQKAGVYRIYSSIYNGHYYNNGPGQTIVIEGGDINATHGEIYGFYLPFLSITALIILLVIMCVIYYLKRKFYCPK